MILPSGHLISVGDKVVVRESDNGKEYIALLVDVDVGGKKDTVEHFGELVEVDRDKIFPFDFNNIMNYKHFKNELGMGICEVTFMKADDTERIMSATLNFDHIPTEKHPKGTNNHITQQESIAVFDVIKEDWRSFRVDSVINFERLTGMGCGSDKPKEKKDEKISS